tara:strand:+ start:3726 stop:5267 length:1542 start_codon:yes stop_codon:yes gene_type:complete
MIMWIGQNYINRNFTNIEEDSFQKINPSTGEVLGEFPKTSKKTVEDTIALARHSFLLWRGKSRVERAEVMLRVAQIVERRREEIATVISLETGKNYNESIAEVNEALHMAQYAFGSGRTPQGEAVASEIAEKDSYMLRKPKGVIAIVSPFNFPVAIGAFWCAAPAIVEGNSVILKPSEDAPYSSQLCAEIYDEAGIPAGVFNVLHGEGATGDALVKGDVDHICFTGSAEVGQHIRKVAAESWHKTTSCEMGSKSAVVVFEDADLGLALDACVASAFKLSGQRCVSAGRILVHKDLMQDFVDPFVERVKQLKTGNPLTAGQNGGIMSMTPENNQPLIGTDSGIDYGPIINKQGLEKVSQYNQMVFEDPEAHVKLKGEVLEGAGNFMTPTVYVSEWRGHEAPYLRNEVFGPHVAIIPFENIEHAIHIYNDTDYGLAVGILTDDFRKARTMRDECDAGMIYWNGGSIAAESHLAFGGVKKSGNGFPSAARTFRAVTHEISWTVNHGSSLAFPQGMK